ncbi:MAG: hypothetical protein K2R98_14885 [Gemmataceae bacterium]|nr:hypothetical protein [Gemmataceae bacterium]
MLRRSTCPHCWTTFPSEDVLWISSHADLMGDPKLGPNQPHRFLPTRFDVEGNALDAKGMVCRSLACPKCHLPLPHAMVEMEPLFVSILGTPACGKSYYLTALTWELRRLLPLHFGLNFLETDTVANRGLTEYEESLFLNPKAEQLVPMADLIRKTELQGDLYDTVMFGSQSVSYPRPFLFTLQLGERHANVAQADRLGRVVCLYDNAGEHFQAGQDSTANPATQHLAKSSLLLYLFDPTQDQRFRRLCEDNRISLADMPLGRAARQEGVLLEAASRVRRYANLPATAKHKRPLIVVVTKWDAWVGLMQDKNIQDPWIVQGGSAYLDFERIQRRSQELRTILLRVTPEVVAAAEGFAQHVTYVPASALGRAPEMDAQTKRLAIRPKQIRPIWVTVPFLYGISQALPGVIAKPSQTLLRAARMASPATTAITPARPAQTATKPAQAGAKPDWLEDVR